MKWDLLLGPLNEPEGNGSKVIVTTRNEKIALALGAKKVEVGKLDDRDCWSIIKYYALCNSQEITEDEGLSYVKNEIISNVKESPLVLRVVGCSLSTKGSLNEWMKKLKQDTLKVSMDFLLHCYNHLPLHLSQCFSYCSLFPKGYKFYIDFHKQEPHLISLWIAQGYIENTCGLTLEETGKNYVEELISQSFFERKSKDYFVVPDLLHDLAEMVAANQCHRVEGYGSLNIPTTCIHLSFCTKENFERTSISDMKAQISKLTDLRTLIILSGPVLKNIFQKGETVLPTLTNLRALYACPNPEMGVLSIHHIDKLKTLRYVRYGKKLPETFAKLYLLKIFILITNQVNSFQNDCKYLKANTLPGGFDNLVELRTLIFYAINGIELDYLYYNSKRINVGKLKSLQNLMAFHPEKDGYRGMMALSELSLCGSLSVLNLEKVQCKVEAEKALLNQKKNLNELIFEWSNTGTDNSDIHEEVLEGLEPHDNLKKLEIKGYQGVKFPTWMKKCFQSLQTLTIRPCTSYEIVLSLPHDLRSLDVYGCSELVQLSFAGETDRTLVLYDFPKSALPSLFSRSFGLRRLTIRECSLNNINLSSLPNLENLCLIKLPNLHSIANLRPALAEFSIVDCPELTSIGNLQCCTSLECLAVFKCPLLVGNEPSLVEGVVERDITNRFPGVKKISTDEPLLVHELVQQQAFDSITHLTLYDLQRPFHMSDEYFHQFYSLAHLRLEDCAALPNLEKLSSLERLGSLHTLCIEGCPDVESLPNLPVSVRSLWICGCQKLKEKYEEGGPVHNSISYIPDIRIC